MTFEQRIGSIYVLGEDPLLRWKELSVPRSGDGTMPGELVKHRGSSCGWGCDGGGEWEEVVLSQAWVAFPALYQSQTTGPESGGWDTIQIVAQKRGLMLGRWEQGVPSQRWLGCCELGEFCGVNSQSLSFLKSFYWSVVDLQCCVSFRYTAKWIRLTYTYIHSVLDFNPV